MASNLVDLVKIKATSIGTGALTLGTAVDGYRGQEALTNGQQYSYSIQQGGNFEIGRGTYLSGTNQLVRSVLYSSTGGTPISVMQGAEVGFVALAEDFSALYSLISLLSTQTSNWSASIQATETLTAGMWTNIYTVSGATRIRKADASDPTKWCNSFVPAAIVSGGVGLVSMFGLNIAANPTDMSDLYLSDSLPGTATTTPPTATGHILQALGTPIPGVGVFFFPQSRILL